MPLLMSSELYPSDIRAACKGVSRAVTCLLIVATLKIFPLLVSSLEMSGCFFLYCGVVMVTVPLVMLCLPETKDVELSQISLMFKTEKK